MKNVGTPSYPASTLTPEQNEMINRKSVDRQDAITEVTWKRGSAGMWGGGLVGTFWGAIFAATAIATTFVFPAAGFSWGLVAVGKMVAAYALLGSGLGTVLGGLVGRISGGVAGGMREQDRSAVARGESIEPVPSEDIGLARRLNLFRGSKKFFNWKNALLFGAIGLSIGAAIMFAVGSGAAALSFIGLGSVVAPAVADGVFLTTMTMYGAFFGCDVPTMVRNATDLAGYVLSGKAWEKKDINSAFTKNDEAFLKSVGSGLGRSSQLQAPTVFKNTHQIEGAYLNPGKNVARVMQQEALTPNQTPTIH